MALSESRRKVLTRKASTQSLEVEHLLHIAVEGDAEDVLFLRALKKEHHWPESNREGNHRVVPLGRWADTVCTFLEQGHMGLIGLAEESPDSASFCLGLLEVHPDPESAATMLAIGKRVVKNPKTDLAFATQLASSLNRLLSFKGAPMIAPAIEQKIRSFLHALLGADLTETQRATAVCALRAVGNEKSLTIIAALPAFANPWTGLGLAACKQIKKRLHGK